MKTRFIVALALVLSGIPDGQAWGQRFRFIPIPRPAPFRLPVIPPIHSPIHPPVHPPIQPPTSIPQNPNPSQPNQPSGNQAESDDISTIVLVCSGIGLFAILTAVIVAVKKLRPSGGLIRIVSTPPGEASRSIREAWVGLEMPLAKSKDQGQELAAMEVFSWKQGCTTGYAVEGRAALERLAAHAPEAAAWWRENVPHVLDAGYQFIFPVENCQKLDG
jgi:hypothetical protein